MEYKEQNIEYGILNNESKIQDLPFSTSYPRHSFRRGFSLLELLIYVAILSGLMVIISDSFISVSKARGQSQARSEVNTAIRFATEKIRQDVKGASLIITPTLGTTNSTLEISTGGKTVIYDILNGQLRRREGDGVSTTTALVTGTNVVANTPVFTRLENYNAQLNATTTAVQTEMTVYYNASSTDWLYSDTIRTTTTLR